MDRRRILIGAALLGALLLGAAGWRVLATDDLHTADALMGDGATEDGATDSNSASRIGRSPRGPAASSSPARERVRRGDAAARGERQPVLQIDGWFQRDVDPELDKLANTTGIGLPTHTQVVIRCTATGRTWSRSVLSLLEQQLGDRSAISDRHEFLEGGPFEVLEPLIVSSDAFGIRKSKRTFSAEELGRVEVELEELPIARVDLRLVDDAGAPLDGIVDLHIGREPGIDVLGLPMQKGRHPQLSFAVATYTAVVREVTGFHPLGSDRPTVTFEVREGATAQPELVVARPAVLRVHLVDEDGEPITDVDVGSKSGGDGRTRYAVAGRTDADGLVVVRPLPPGEIALLVNALGRPAVTQRVSLVSGEERDLEIVVAAGGVALAGRFVGVERERIKQLNLAYRSSSVMEAFNLRTDEIGEDGSFRVEGLRPGLYDVHPVLTDGTSGYRRVELSEPLTQLGEVDLSPLVETGDITVFCVTTVEGWDRPYYWGQYRREGWPDGFFRFVRLSAPGLTHVDLPVGTYTFRLTPEANATDAFGPVSVERFVVAPDHVETNSVELHAERR